MAPALRVSSRQIRASGRGWGWVELRGRGVTPQDGRTLVGGEKAGSRRTQQ